MHRIHHFFVSGNPKMKINVKNQKVVSKCIIRVVIIMNVGFAACIILAVFFLILGIMFALLKEKGAQFVSGFRILNHPEKYDKANISRDMRNQCFIYFVILSIGAILSYFLSAYIALAALLVWLIIFFHNFNLDAEKAFEKYLIH